MASWCVSVHGIIVSSVCMAWSWLNHQQARDELMDYVCQKEMAVYTQIFHTQGETAHLERCVMWAPCLSLTVGTLTVGSLTGKYARPLT